MAHAYNDPLGRQVDSIGVEVKIILIEQYMYARECSKELAC